MADIKMVIGLGNPGGEYADTRHNIGFMVIDALAGKLAVEVKKKKFGARFGEAGFGDKKLILLKPWLFMNNSGQSVAAAAGFYQLGPMDLFVITDDMDLPPGRIRIRPKGSAGGHKGLADIIEKLGTDGFARLRIGIGRDTKDRTVDFVLGRPTDSQQELIGDAIERAKEAAVCWLRSGIDAAMNEFNRSDSAGEKDSDD